MLVNEDGYLVVDDKLDPGFVLIPKYLEKETLSSDRTIYVTEKRVRFVVVFSPAGVPLPGLELKVRDGSDTEFTVNTGPRGVGRLTEVEPGPIEVDFEEGNEAWLSLRVAHLMEAVAQKLPSWAAQTLDVETERADKIIDKFNQYYPGPGFNVAIKELIDLHEAGSEQLEFALTKISRHPGGRSSDLPTWLLPKPATKIIPPAYHKVALEMPPAAALDIPKEEPEPTRIAFFIHGMGGNPEELRTLIDQATEAGEAPVIYTWSTADTLTSSAKGLFDLVCESNWKFGLRKSRKRLRFVAHSAGARITAEMFAHIGDGLAGKDIWLDFRGPMIGGHSGANALKETGQPFPKVSFFAQMGDTSETQSRINLLSVPNTTRGVVYVGVPDTKGEGGDKFYKGDKVKANFRIVASNLNLKTVELPGHDHTSVLELPLSHPS